MYIIVKRDSGVSKPVSDSEVARESDLSAAASTVNRLNALNTSQDVVYFMHDISS